MKKIVLGLLFSSAAIVAMDEWPVIGEELLRVSEDRQGLLHASVQLRCPVVFPDLETPYKITMHEHSSGALIAKEHFLGFHNGKRRAIERPVDPGSQYAVYASMLALLQHMQITCSGISTGH